MKTIEERVIQINWNGAPIYSVQHHVEIPRWNVLRHINYMQTNRSQLTVHIGVKESFPWIGSLLSLLPPDNGLYNHFEDGTVMDGKVLYKVPVIQKQLSVLTLECILLPDICPWVYLPLRTYHEIRFFPSGSDRWMKSRMASLMWLTVAFRYTRISVYEFRRVNLQKDDWSIFTICRRIASPFSYAMRRSTSSWLIV